MSFDLASVFAELNGKTIRILTEKRTISVANNSPDYSDLLLDLIFSYSGLKYKLVAPNTAEHDDHGVYNRKTGIWSGGLGYLQRGEADLMLEPMSMSEERLFHFDFLPPLSVEQYGFQISDDVANDNAANTNETIFSIITYDRTFGALQRIFVPFLFQAWFGILITFLIVVAQCMLYEFIHESNSPRRKPNENQQKHHSEDDVLWHTDDDDDRYWHDARRPAKHGFGLTLVRVAESIIRTGETLIISMDQLLRPLFNQGPTLSPSTAASQVVILTWCLCSVLITSLYSANLTTIFGAAPALKTPFNNISSLYNSGYRVLVPPGTSSEQLIRNLAANLVGTDDGYKLAEVIRYSEPYWTRNSRNDYGPQLRRQLPVSLKMAETNSTQKLPPPYDASMRFALLSSSNLREKLQTKQCDLRAHSFYYPLDSNATKLVPTPERPVTLVLQKNSNFTEPLTRVIHVMHTMGVLGMLKVTAWRASMESHTITNGELYQCANQLRRKLAKQQRWSELTLRGLLPTFTLLTTCYATAMAVFGIERLVEFVKLRHNRWRVRLQRAVRKYSAVHQFQNGVAVRNKTKWAITSSTASTEIQVKRKFAQ